MLGIFGNIFVIIPAGHVGVVYDPLNGGVQTYELKEGFHLMPPWIHVVEFSMRTQALNMHPGGDDISLTVLTAEGLQVGMDITVLYRIEPNKAHEVYKNVGEDYVDIIMIPSTRAAVRDLVALYHSEDLYTTDKRITLQRQLKQKLEKQLEGRGILIEDVLIRDIILPERVTEAIETKLRAEQEALTMQYILQKEKLEAQRKVVEAQGIADSQRIIAESLTDKYLRWYWINTLKDQNSVIYIPIGENGMPIFKDVDNINTTQ